MAFNKENFYTEGNSPEYFFSRTNPLANPANAEILKVSDCCCEGFQLVAEVETTAGSTVVTFSSPTSGYNTRFIKVVINDGQGNFVAGVGTGTVSSITIDTSSLNANVNWTVQVIIETTDNVAVDCPCSQEFSFPYNVTQSPYSVDTTTLGAQVAQLRKPDGTVVADGGTYNLGTFAIGTSEPFEIQVWNVGGHVLTVGTLAKTSQVLTFVKPTFGSTIFPNSYVTYSGTVNTNLTAGAKTGTITVNSDDPSNAAYAITIGYTLA
jgi:hypothetical protein